MTDTCFRCGNFAVLSPRYGVCHDCVVDTVVDDDNIRDPRVAAYADRASRPVAMATAKQLNYLRALARKAGEPVEAVVTPGLSSRDASQRIKRLQAQLRRTPV